MLKGEEGCALNEGVIVWHCFQIVSCRFEHLNKITPMKSLLYFILKRSQVSFLTMLLVTFCSYFTAAQSPTPVFARLTMQKVPAGKEQEYVKFMKETMKPMHTLRRTKGKIIHWILFKVHFTGDNDAYNYVGVSYYTSWANTEANEVLADLYKEVNPKADPAAIAAQLQGLRTVVSQALIYRTEAVEPPTPLPFKFVRLDYMKVKPGMNASYLKIEREDWMPFHKTLLESGQATAWGLWRQLFPSGSDFPFDYITSSRYGTYAQVMETDYEKTFKKASPSKDLNAIFDRTTKSRDLVKSELWEVVEMLN